MSKPSVSLAPARQTRASHVEILTIEPEDISHAVVYLASDESRYVTGQQLRIDAGAGMKIGL